MSGGGSIKAKRQTMTRLEPRRAVVPSARRETSLARGQVARADESGVVSVRLGDGRELECDRLETSAASSLRLVEGDAVLVFTPARRGERGVVIGRIGPSRHAAETPEELVLEATSSVSLRCGESSVTLRKDGRVVVRGQDVVSHAARVNRIRGGSVSIN